MNFSDIVKKNLEKGILLSPDLLDATLEDLENSKASVITKDSIELSKNNSSVDWTAFEKARVLMEKNNDSRMYNRFLDVMQKKNEEIKPVEIVLSYTEPSRKRSFDDFVNYFNARFKMLEAMLRNRQELQRLTSIGKLKNRKEKGAVAIIGIIYEKLMTKNGNVMFTLEDPTGFMRVVVSKNKPEMFAIAQDCMLDEVIGIEGMYDNIIFANSVILPDIPLTKELKKSPEDEYLAFIGDTQVGSKNFLEKDFMKMLYWFQGKTGNDEQKEIASKIRYIVIPGDLVEGVGVYPDQEKDLSIFDIEEQYAKFAEYMKLIPSHIQIIVCPGNHDAGRLAEPQPLLYKDFAKALWDMPNVHIVSNPAVVNIGKTKDFPGFDILIYHGGSMFYLAAEVESIRSKGGIIRADLIMRHMLQRRHLAASHASTVYIPDPERDPLVIQIIPDFMVTGHIHRVQATNYRNITMINASAWTGITENQIRRGLEPQPARLPVVNLKTREVKIMNFLGKEEAEKIKNKKVD
jgi:DNA polymerase II small subunit